MVLSVPRYAADQAVEHARRQRGRVTAGNTCGNGDESLIEAAASALLRTAYPYLAGDSSPDGPVTEASAEVRAARAAERGGQGGQD